MTISYQRTSLGLAVTALLVGLALSGCTSVSDTLSGGKVDYKSASATKGPSLDVPPDLSQLTRDSRYVVPGMAVSANAYQVTQPNTATPTAANTMGDVRIERAGNQRWLVVNRPADKLWDPVREFWKESGFQLPIEQAELGILETDFAENRAKLPQDFIRNTIGKVLDSLYSTGERDKFRTRLERTANGGTEIFISHRGMVEVVSSTSAAGGSGSTIWQPRPADPELEAEFLRRLMVKLGVTQEQSKALVASGVQRQTSRMASVNGIPVLQIDEGFERAWRRVGLALDRTGFTVEDRDRAQGLYFVRYVSLTTDAKESGFFSKLFSSSTAPSAPLKYRIALNSKDESTSVSVLNAEGKPETSVNAERIIKVLADDLK
ncbi:MAG: outer membrane protein assembly factor BamC [Polaromonas sp.]|nr:outer membrane protein assembly factor BamC [Polaromonas sp.]